MIAQESHETSMSDHLLQKKKQRRKNKGEAKEEDFEREEAIDIANVEVPFSSPSRKHRNKPLLPEEEIEAIHREREEEERKTQEKHPGKSAATRYVEDEPDTERSAAPEIRMNLISGSSPPFDP